MGLWQNFDQSATRWGTARPATIDAISIDLKNKKPSFVKK